LITSFLQFNDLTFTQRVEITKECSEREAKLKADVELKDEDMYLTCMMVDFNIVATRYAVDSATVCMCIKPPCKNNKNILVK
jgi:hypothetical protein